MDNLRFDEIYTQKNKLYKIFLTSRSDADDTYYKQYRNKLTHLLRCAKSNYYLQRFTEVQQDIGETWKLIKQVVNENRAPMDTIDALTINGKETTNMQNIVNHFNTYFTNVGKSLAAKVPQARGNYCETITAHYTVSDAMFIKPTDKTEIINIVHNLKLKKSTGHDCFPTKVLKAVIECIAQPLVDICNLSFSSAVFPDKLKIAKICPIYKCEDKKIVSNYRPISILSVFSKILEKLMYDRLLCFLDSHQILEASQYGFRRKHSTYMALLDLVDKISCSLDDKLYSIGVFMDLSKAFDTVDHTILLDKLQLYGVRGLACDWFKDYLNNRKQFVQIGDVRSSYLTVTCGVPQGSILGPLLFLIYINDIIHVSDKCDAILFADDTNLFFQHKDLKCLTDIVNDELSKIFNWFNLNKLSVNLKKTNFMLFKMKNKKYVMNNKIQINNTEIMSVEKTKFLGVIINENLTWNDHVMLIKQKIAKSIGVISRVRYCMPRMVLLQLYHTLIEPYLIYCNIIWAANHSTTVNQLFIMQKKAVRLITFSHWQCHTKPLFIRLSLLSVQKINRLQLACFMYNARHKLLPVQFTKMFILNTDVHKYGTRHSEHIHRLHYRTNVCKYTARFLGPSLWNTLSDELKKLPTYNLFKQKMSEFLLLSDAV